MCFKCNQIFKINIFSKPNDIWMQFLRQYFHFFKHDQNLWIYRSDYFLCHYNNLTHVEWGLSKYFLLLLSILVIPHWHWHERYDVSHSQLMPGSPDSKPSFIGYIILCSFSCISTLKGSKECSSRTGAGHRMFNCVLTTETPWSSNWVRLGSNLSHWMGIYLYL